MPEKQNISIIIPTYKEEKRIERCINESLFFFRNNPRVNNFEIIFVSDDAGDNTIDIIKKNLPENPELKLLVNSERLQKGFSVKRGVLEAKNAIIMFYDVDLSTPLYETNKFLDEIDNYDMLIASRGLNESNVEKQWYKAFLSRGFSILKRLMLGTDVTDTQCGFKMFKNKCKELFQLQTIKTSTFDLEILHIAKKKGFTVKELPVTWIDSDASNFSTIGNIKQCFFDVLKILNASRKGKYN